MMKANSSIEMLYGAKIRVLANSVRNDKRLPLADFSSRAVSNLCGSILDADFQFCDKAISSFGYRVRACTLGMASVALFSQVAIGQTRKQILSAAHELKSALSGTSEFASLPAQWEQYQIFNAAKNLVARHESILLPFTALFLINSFEPN